MSNLQRANIGKTRRQQGIRRKEEMGGLTHCSKDIGTSACRATKGWPDELAAAQRTRLGACLQLACPNALEQRLNSRVGCNRRGATSTHLLCWGGAPPNRLFAAQPSTRHSWRNVGIDNLLPAIDFCQNLAQDIVGAIGVLDPLDRPQRRKPQTRRVLATREPHLVVHPGRRANTSALFKQKFRVMLGPSGAHRAPEKRLISGSRCE